MSRSDAPLAARRRRSKSATIEVASDPETSNSTRPFSCTVAWKSLRFTAVSSQSFTISSASRRVRPWVSASSRGISANHQRPSRTSRPANLMSVPCTPFAELRGRVVRSPQRGAARIPRLRRLSRRHADYRDAGTATRMREDVFRARASSQSNLSVHQDVSSYSCGRPTFGRSQVVLAQAHGVLCYGSCGAGMAGVRRRFPKRTRKRSDCCRRT